MWFRLIRVSSDLSDSCFAKNGIADRRVSLSFFLSLSPPGTGKISKIGRSFARARDYDAMGGDVSCRSLLLELILVAFLESKLTSSARPLCFFHPFHLLCSAPSPDQVRPMPDRRASEASRGRPHRFSSRDRRDQLEDSGIFGFVRW